MRKLWTPRWLLVHAAAVILVVGFLLLGWWQVTRAASGNLISFGYAVEWPAFAAFVIYVWVKEMRQAVRGVAPASGGQTIGGTHAEPAADGGADAPVPRRPPRPRRSLDLQAFVQFVLDCTLDNRMTADNVLGRLPKSGGTSMPPAMAR